MDTRRWGRDQRGWHGADAVALDKEERIEGRQGRAGRGSGGAGAGWGTRRAALVNVEGIVGGGEGGGGR